MIRGPKDDVEKAKQQLLELSNERQLSSVSAEVRAKPQHHKFLIGKSGANIKRIRDNTGARIIFPTDKDEDKEVGAFEFDVSLPFCFRLQFQLFVLNFR